jgi:threonine/homoserine/homoserine lactone efflux protein
VIEIFIKGLAAGFIVAVPLGPVGILCFRRVLREGRLVGILTVVGAGLADAIYGTAAAFGLRALTHALTAHREALRAAGGIFLLFLGIRMIRSREVEPKPESSARDVSSAFLTAFLLMIANPSIMISFLGVFAVLDLGSVSGFSDLAWLGPAVFLGSAAWWGVYSLAKWRFKDKLSVAVLRAIDVSAGALICGFGVWQLIELALGR